MSFLYPHSCIITRPAVPVELGAGLQPAYSGESPDKEVPVAGPFACAIQMKTMSGKPAGGMPGDASAKTFWLILIPALGPGVANVRDIITDELKFRYAITSSYVTPMGANFVCERLDA